MGASKEYFMRLREEEFESLESEAQNYLMHLGMQVRQLPTKLDESDEHYQKIRKHRIETWNKEQEYLYQKRINETNNNPIEN